ncbi:hypothetical protein BZA70DRAFT_70556 [Myxozyma melibiosi]|uniref:EDC4-like protein pdc1 beta-propeller domain-containing protein n=1 Tax=Myxozyma melibiosi TaxID=54550 RepID=A0ABR1F1E4_9ASCO
MASASKNLLSMLQGGNSATTAQAPPPPADPAISFFSSASVPAPSAASVNVEHSIRKAGSSKSSPASSSPDVSLASQADGLKNLLAAGGSKSTIAASEPSSTATAAPVSRTSSTSSAPKPRFTYVNPFHELEAQSSPSPRASTPTPKKSPTPPAPQIVDPAILNSVVSKPKEPAPLDPAILSSAIKPSQPPTVPSAASSTPAIPPSQPAVQQRPQTTRKSPKDLPGFRLPLEYAKSVSIDTVKNFSHITEELCDGIANFTRDISASDRHLLAVNDDFIAYPIQNAIRVLSQTDGSFSILTGHEENRIVDLLFSTFRTESGSSLLVSTTANNEVIVWELLTSSFKDTRRDSHYRKLLRIEKLPPNSDHVPRARVHWPPVTECVAVSMSKKIYVFPLNSDTFLDIRRSSLIDRVGQSAVAIDTENGTTEFVYSPDGTAIAALNKLGTIALYDLSTLPPLGQGAEKATIRSPLKTFIPREGMRYCSINFLDAPEVVKAQKPLRFLLLGFNQNHSFHVYDLTTGSIVEELHLPQCVADPSALNLVSIAPSSGVVVISDTERNAMLFLHFAYAGSDAAASSSIASEAELLKGSIATVGPNPASTGCDYITSYGFIKDHRIISLSLLESISEDEPDALFDLYVLHTEGATIFPVLPKYIAHNEWKSAPLATNAHVSALRQPAPATVSGDSPGSSLPAAKGLSETSTRSSTPTPVKKQGIVPFGAMKARQKSTAKPTPAVPATAKAESSSPSPTPAPAPAATLAVEEPSIVNDRKRSVAEISSTPKLSASEPSPEPAEKRVEQETVEKPEVSAKKESPEDSASDDEVTPAAPAVPAKAAPQAPASAPAVSEAATSSPSKPGSDITVPTSPGFNFRPTTASNRKKKEILTRESANALGLPAPSVAPEEASVAAPVETAKKAEKKEKPAAKEKITILQRETPSKVRSPTPAAPTPAASESADGAAAGLFSGADVKLFTEYLSITTAAAVEKALASQPRAAPASSNDAAATNGSTAAALAQTLKKTVETTIKSEMRKMAEEQAKIVKGIEDKLDVVLAQLAEKDKKNEKLQAALKQLM